MTTEKTKFRLGFAVFSVALFTAWAHSVSFGYNQEISANLVSWLCMGVGTAALLLTNRVEYKWVQPASLVFVGLGLLILLRNGPIKMHALSLALICASMVAVSYTSSVFLEEKRNAALLQNTVLLFAATNAIVGLLQYFGLIPISWGMLIEPSSEGQAVGQLRQRNMLGIVCVIGIATLLMRKRSFFTNYSFLGSLSDWLLLIVMICCIAATQSRISALALLLSIGLISLSWKQMHRTQLLMTLTAVPLFLIATWVMPLMVGSASVWERFLGESQCTSRSYIWRDAIELIRLKPWTGVGWGGTIGSLYNLESTNRACDLIDHVHNVYLALAVESGVIAGLAALILSFYVLITNYRQLKRQSLRGWSLLGLLIIGLYAQTEYPLWTTHFLWLFAIFLGVTMARPRRHHDAHSPTFLLRYANLIMTAVVVIVSVIALLQYTRISSITDQEQWLKFQALYKDTDEMEKNNWIFVTHLQYIQAAQIKPTNENARLLNRLCNGLLYYSPEPNMLACLVDTHKRLGEFDQAKFHEIRFHELFPEIFQAWVKSGKK